MSRAAPLLALAAVCALCGCSGRATQAPPRVTAEGRVEAHGRPVPLVLVRFYPQDAADANSYDGHAEDDGSFRVECPAGRYKVTITPLPAGRGGNPAGGALAGTDPKGGKDVPAAYRARTTTTLEVEVPAGGKKGITLTLH